MKVVMLVGLCALFGSAAAIGQCNVCKFAFGVLEDKLRNNHTQSAIISELDQLCLHLPQQIASECDNIVENYGRTLINVVDHMSPSQFCNTLHICKASLLGAEPKAISEGCTLCEAFLSYIRTVIGNKKAEEEIKADLEKVCNHVPEKVRDECGQFVSQYTDKIINMLVNDLHPKAVCQDVHLCKAARTQF